MNENTDKELLHMCIYGHCLRRLLHGIHRQRLEFPSKKIFVIKMDLDAAYRRLHVRTDQAVQSISIVDNIGFIETRLPFGGTMGPSEYSIVSEAIFDTMNDLASDRTWNYETLQSDFLKKSKETEINLRNTRPEHEEIVKARPLAIKIPYRGIFVDGFIDDGIAAAVDINDNVERARHVGPLVVESVFRPLDENDQVERNNAVQEAKGKTEGIPSENPTVLGWYLCTRSFRIYLPQEKAIEWIKSINDI